MAVLTPSQIKPVYDDGQCGRTQLYALKNVTAADTLDLAGYFTVIKRAGIVSDTGVTIGACSIAGTVVTIPAGPDHDGVWLLACGVAA